MKLVEYKVKGIFSKYAISTPKGAVAQGADTVQSIEAKAKSAGVSFPAAVKAQVLSGGRGKAGGIKFAANPLEAKARASEIIGMKIGGYTVKEVLIESKLDVAKELYLSITLDRSARSPVILASAEGGVEIESVPESKLFRAQINPLTGIQPFLLRNLARKLSLPAEQGKQVADIARKLYDAFVKEDAELAEINPLIITKSGQAVAADGKMIIDEDALYRHPEHKQLDADLTPLEEIAREKGISFVQLDGDIGVIANGAGLTMATLDYLMLHGGKAGTFLDLGGTDDPEKVKEALRIIKMAKPKVVLINIFGGITRCDTVATGIRDILKTEGIEAPVVVRIKGSREDEAKTILGDAGLFAVNTLSEAAQKVIELEKAG